MSVVRLASWSALWHCYHAPKKKHAKAGQMVPESSSKRGKRFPVMLAHTHALPAAAILVAACIGFCLQTWRASPPGDTFFDPGMHVANDVEIRSGITMGGLTS